MVKVCGCSEALWKQTGEENGRSASKESEEEVRRCGDEKYWSSHRDTYGFHLVF